MQAPWTAARGPLPAAKEGAKRREAFPALTGLRAVAGALVYAHHFPGETLSGWPRLHAIVLQGYVGVALFFVLSGFLIHYSYAQAMRFELAWFGRYFRNRVARIFPLYLLALGCTHVLGAQSPPVSWWRGLLLLQGLSAQHKFDGVIQAWSLTVEETFYLTFPLVVLASRRLRRPFLTCLGATYLLGLALTAVGTRLPRLEAFESLLFTGGYTFFGRAFEFYLGMALSRRYLAGRRPPATRATWTYVGATAALAAAASLGFLVRPGVGPAFALSSYRGLVVNNVVFPAAVGVLLWGLITERSSVRRLLAGRPMQLLGRASYAFYLFHANPAQALLARAGLSRGEHGVLVFVALQALAVALYLGVERPLHRWLKAGPEPRRAKPFAPGQAPAAHGSQPGTSASA